MFGTVPVSVGDWGNDFVSLEVCRKLLVAARFLPAEPATHCVFLHDLSRVEHGIRNCICCLIIIAEIQNLLIRIVGAAFGLLPVQTLHEFADLQLQLRVLF